MGVYLGDWSCFDEMVNDFVDASSWEGATQEERNALIAKTEGANILFAYYEYKDYEGRAFVLFRKDDKLYEVNGGRCSCYGLEGQWDPEETSVEALSIREYPEEYNRELRALLATLS